MFAYKLITSTKFIHFLFSSFLMEFLCYIFYFFIDRHPFGRLPAFLYDCLGLLIIRPTMFAAISMALGTYVVKPFFPGGCDPPGIVVKVVTIVAICKLFSQILILMDKSR